jgi:hypothetical protein
MHALPSGALSSMQLPSDGSQTPTLHASPFQQSNPISHEPTVQAPASHRPSRAGSGTGLGSQKSPSVAPSSWQVIQMSWHVPPRHALTPVSETHTV